jgi:hypothetical protein
MKKWLILHCTILLPALGIGQTLAILEYDGGGDWYANPTALPNLASFCNAELGTTLTSEYAEVSLKDDQIFSYPFVHMTGHGNVVFSREEINRLRLYLDAGGFIHIDDNYGMDPFIRPILEELFPESRLIQLNPEDRLFQTPFPFPEGLPKIHEHDGSPPEAWAIYRGGKMVLLYTHESDLSDGWEDAEVHNDPEEVRLEALRMGANIMYQAFTQKPDDNP